MSTSYRNTAPVFCINWIHPCERNADEHFPAPLWRVCDSDVLYKCHHLLTYMYLLAYLLTKRTDINQTADRIVALCGSTSWSSLSSVHDLSTEVNTLAWCLKDFLRIMITAQRRCTVAGTMVPWGRRNP